MGNPEGDVQFVSETINLDPISSWSNNMRRMYYRDEMSPPHPISSRRTDSPIVLEDEPSRPIIDLSDDERDDDNYNIFAHRDCLIPYRPVTQNRDGFFTRKFYLLNALFHSPFRTSLISFEFFRNLL